ncbi:signal peptide peptidase SppA [Flavobacterium sp. MAH-1]|uniref:Signal peptide peptidase SppA n=1 Tax=Flavobacterium agri TaxID=2743471 RepID=A0A7Y8Y389_9FLAO|nr:signal peptide peptidase SppA [Flavobacterium agri]NUY81652.1 signal peptide peptidase SppA [Flavobacterium agri]NYA71676.1 signal peptide peptidase SppA [Flavobacterium agri]
MKFFGNVLATVVGLFLFFMISFFMLILFSALFGGDPDAVNVQDNSVLVFDMENVSNDYGGKYSDPLVTMFSEGKSIGVSDILNAISEAKNDDKIKGISILNDNSLTGIAQTKALRDALLDFKKSGKFVVAYSNAYSQKEYYLNSVADEIYLNPGGEVDFKGLSTEVMFFKDFQEKSGITMEVIRHGKYKSAVEPFLDNKMSEANREQLTALLNSIWNSIATEVSQSRKIPIEKLNELANTLGARTPEMAKANKLIDKITYEDEYHNDIRKRLKVDQDEKYNKVELLDYARNVATTPSNFASDKIAIVYAQGEILSGEGDVGYIGEGSIRRSLQEARKDENVKAVVLRVDSPGGSALTSDLIWREIELTKKKKPVVVSMGNYAASGGYYISCNANKIFAESGTITGSIGVFGTLPNVTKLSNKIGINSVQVKTHANASGYSPFVPLDDNFRNQIQGEIERIYTTFTTKVAQGRKMTVAQVDSIAQGRVWTGAEAIKIGLVDKIGGMDDAIKEAAKLAKTTDYRTQDFPEYDKKFADLLAGFPFAQSKDEILKEELGAENFEILQQAKRMTQRKGVQALLPVKIDIH